MREFRDSKKALFGLVLVALFLPGWGLLWETGVLHTAGVSLINIAFSQFGLPPVPEH